MTTATYTYSSEGARGSAALAAAGLASLLAILILAGVMMVKSCRRWRLGGAGLSQTHIAPYLISLLLANTLQALGSVLNISWILKMGTHYDPTCVAQGVMKNIGNVGVALWSLIIAFHAFDVLFRRNSQSRVTLWSTILGTWSLVAVVDLIGPVIVQKPASGPFFGVSGYWCWITPRYPRARIFLEYFFMFASAFLCAILHSIIFLRLRGNLSGDNWRRMRFRRIRRSERWVLQIARDEVDGSMYKVAMQLMWYPLVYVLVIIPIAAARFAAWAGKPVPFSVTIATDFVFNLHGLLNVILFCTTYRHIPVEHLPTLATPRKSLYITNFGITPFILTPQPAHTKGFPEMQSRTDLDV